MLTLQLNSFILKSDQCLVSPYVTQGIITQTGGKVKEHLSSSFIALT